MNVSKSAFRTAFGVEISDAFSDAIASLKNVGLIEETEDDVRVTNLGRLYVDNISKMFYNTENRRVPQPLEPELRLLSARGVWNRSMLARTAG